MVRHTKSFIFSCMMYVKKQRLLAQDAALSGEATAYLFLFFFVALFLRCAFFAVFFFFFLAIRTVG